MINPGTYQAKLIDYGIFKKDGKDPSVIANFVLLETAEEITWFGSLSEKAKTYTAQTLIDVFGYKGTTGIDIANGKGSGVLNENQHYELVIITDNYSGSPRAKIKYVNVPGQGVSANKIDASQAKIVIGGLGLDGVFMDIRSRDNWKQPKKITLPREVDNDVDF